MATNLDGRSGEDRRYGSWHGENVDVSIVRRAMVQTLQELNPSPTTANVHPPIRTSLLNRIVRVSTGADESRVRKALDEVAELHPSRTVVIETEHAAPSGLDARIRAHCQLRSESGPQVCFEELQITARGDLANHLSGIVSPLLVPEMPVVLWWMGEAPEEGEDLLQLCDRIVLDSDLAGATGLTRVKRLVDLFCPRRIVTDLAWAELSPWRELISQLFDPAESRPFQQDLRTLELQYVAGARTTRPHLLVGWLAAMLGWKPKESPDVGMKDSEWEFGTATGALSVSMSTVPASGTLQPGDLVQVTMRALRGQSEATFAVIGHEDGQCATIRTVRAGHPEQTRVVPLKRSSWSSLLSGELDRRRADPTYRASLEMAVQIVSATGYGEKAVELPQE